jgi:hypothetical protein
MDLEWAKELLASSSSSSGRPASAASNTNASAQSDPSDISERDMSATGSKWLEQCAHLME